MYKILKSTPNGIDELELEQLEKGCWIDIVSPSPEELHEIAAATKIQLDFLTAALDEEEKSRIETEDDQILILVDIPFLRSNKDYDTLPLGIIIAEDFIVTVWSLTLLLLTFLPIIIVSSAPSKKRGSCSRSFINQLLYI